MNFHRMRFLGSRTYALPATANHDGTFCLFSKWGCRQPQPKFKLDSAVWGRAGGPDDEAGIYQTSQSKVGGGRSKSARGIPPLSTLSSCTST
jgi:hypothetical protein